MKSTYTLLTFKFHDAVATVNGPVISVREDGAVVPIQMENLIKAFAYDHESCVDVFSVGHINYDDASDTASIMFDYIDNSGDTHRGCMTVPTANHISYAEVGSLELGMQYQ